MANEVRDLIDPTLPILMMSLHPENVAAIKAGVKKVEYRRRFYKDPFQAFVCTTGSRGGVELFLRFGKAVRGSAGQLAAFADKAVRDDYWDIFEYYRTVEQGCIIPIERVAVLKKISRTAILKRHRHFTVPQAYYFLDTPEKIGLLNTLAQRPVVQTSQNDWAKVYANLDFYLEKGLPRPRMRNNVRATSN